MKFVQEAVADAAKVIQQQGDAGLGSTSKFWQTTWRTTLQFRTFTLEPSGEYYGQLVVYYSANSLVPPDSRH